MDPIEILLARLASSRVWPLRSEAALRARLGRWIAFRESDERILRALADWRTDRPYVIDPLPAKIAEAFGTLLFGEDPEGVAADPADVERLRLMLEDVGFAADLQPAEETCVSEGEVWWRATVNLNAADHPIVTWHSRYDVIPLLHGREPIAVAFVSRLTDPASAGERSQIVYRHLEIHQAGRMVNVLYRGRQGALGGRVDPGRHPMTADLPEEWRHGLSRPLCGRVVNKWGRTPHVGVSAFEGIWQQFLVLNEATTIGRENLRLTAKKRAVVPQSALRAREPSLTAGADRGDGTLEPRVRPADWDATEDVLVADPLDVEEGREQSGPFKVLEYSFDAAALIAYQDHVAQTVCQRCDIVPQFIGSGDFGSGNSGTALRVRLLPTINASEGRARAWDRELPRIVETMQLLEALPMAQGGIGRSEWVAPAGRPSINRSTALPEDPAEQATRHATLKTADLISIWRSVREQNRDWSDDQVDEEVERIRGDVQAMAPAATFGGGGGDPTDPPTDPPPEPGGD